MSKRSPFYKYDALTYLGGSIQFCSLEQKGLFHDISALYWRDEKPVKIDAKFKVRYTHLEVNIDLVVQNLVDLGIVIQTEAGLEIKFLKEQLHSRKEWIEKCSKAGKKSASIQGTSSNKKEDIRKEKEDIRKKSLKTKGKSEEPELELEGEQIEKELMFDDFYEHYPKKKSKDPAKKAWLKMTNEERQEAIRVVQRYPFEKEMKFIPLPASWLNKKMWQDDITSGAFKKRTFSIPLIEDKDKPEKVPAIAKDPSEMQPEI